MNNRVQKLIAASVLLALCTTGCATTGVGQGAGSNSEDATRTKAEGAGLGALAGVAIGGLIGNAMGGKNGMVKGMAAGALLGGGAGYIAGSKVAERKQQYVSEEARLDGEISMSEQYNNELISYNNQTRDRIKTLKQQSLDLKSRHKADQRTAYQLQKKRDEIQATINESEIRKNSMNNELSAMNNYLEDLKKEQKNGQKDKEAKLNQELVALKANIDTLDTNNKQLAKLLTTNTVRK